MVLQRYSNDTPTILQRYSHGTPTILQWYSHSTSTILQRYSHGTSMILQNSNTPMVLPRYSHGTPMILQRYSHGTPLILQLFFGVSEVSLFPPWMRTNATDHSQMNRERHLHQPLPILLIFSFQLVLLNFRRSMKHQQVLHRCRSMVKSPPLQVISLK